jgi:hypothetical protein
MVAFAATCNSFSYSGVFWVSILQDTGGEFGVLLAAVATPPAGRDQSGPYPNGHRFARLSPAIRHQYPSG